MPDPVDGTSEETPRPLTDAERRLLDGLLSHDFPGVHELRVQARSVRATSGCTCGCGTIDLHVSPDLPTAAGPRLVPVEGTFTGDDGEPAGGVLLFLDEGRMSGLEVYSFEDEPLPIPSAQRVTWGAIEDPPRDDVPRRSLWRRLRRRP